jgi:hypothetical protein
MREGEALQKWCSWAYVQQSKGNGGAGGDWNGASESAGLLAGNAGAEHGVSKSKTDKSSVKFLKKYITKVCHIGFWNT